MKRVAIYARVSTADKNQNPETQLRPLREYAKQRGFEIVTELVDEASGRTTDREGFKQLMQLARRRHIDVVLVFRYSRFARSVQALVSALDEFGSISVDFISLHENFDTTTPMGKLLFTIMAGLAEFESELISENVRAGMARAKAQGKQIGQRPTPDDTKQKILDLKSKGLSIRQIAKEVGVAVGTVHACTKNADM